MSPAQSRLTTLVLAVVAGWSLLVYLAVQFGLGARYGLHPDDAGQLPPPSSLQLDRASSPLRPLSAYAEVNQRALFSPDRRPPAPPAALTDAGPAPVAPAALNVLLTSVILSGDRQIAIVTDRQTNKSQSLKPGQALAGEQSAWKLVELQARRAVFDGPGGRTTVQLRVFDGTGGEAPTPVAVATVAAEDASSASASGAAAGGGGGQPSEPVAAPDTPESRAETIRRRIEERRRQMREEAMRAGQEREQ